LALISSVTVPSLLRLLSSPASLLAPRYENKSSGPYLILQDRDIYQTLDITSSAARWLSPSYDSVRTEPQESRRLRNPCPPENPARGVRQLGFWRALPRLLIFVFFLVTLTRHRLHLLLGDAHGTTRHGESLPASPVVHDFEQRTSPHTMTGGASASRASDAFSMGPSSGYTRNSSFVFFIICVLRLVCHGYMF
jgi:hypothetical protein